VLACCCWVARLPSSFMLQAGHCAALAAAWRSQMALLLLLLPALPCPALSCPVGDWVDALRMTWTSHSSRRGGRLRGFYVSAMLFLLARMHLTQLPCAPVLPPPAVPDPAGPPCPCCSHPRGEAEKPCLGVQGWRESWAERASSTFCGHGGGCKQDAMVCCKHMHYRALGFIVPPNPSPSISA